MIYIVWKVMQDGTEERVGQTDFADPEKAITSAMVEARKWWKVVKAPTKPRKPERVPSHIVVRETKEGSAQNFAHHVIEVTRTSVYAQVTYKL